MKKKDEHLQKLTPQSTLRASSFNMTNFSQKGQHPLKFKETAC